VLVFSLGFAFTLVLVAHTYLTPFGAPRGQLVLMVIATLYALGLTMMVSLARPPTPVRLLGGQVVEA
jgi:Flp pilus assembly protein TadB